LSVHDIGETKLGDVFTFHKKGNEDDDETKIARELLDDKLFAYYEEYQEQKTIESKYAKCLDKISPKLHHISADKESGRKLFKHYGFTAQTIEDKQLSLFDWDANLKAFFEEIIRRLREISE